MTIRYLMDRLGNAGGIVAAAAMMLVLVAAPAPAMADVLEVRVASSSDDARETLIGTVHLDLNYLIIKSNRTVGLRFADLGIPQGSVIVNA